MDHTRHTRVSFHPVWRFFSGLFYYLLIGPVMIVAFIFRRLRVRGLANLNEAGLTEGFFLFSNHSLYLDPVYLAAALFPRRVIFTGHSGRFILPGIATVLRLLGSFAIPRPGGLKPMMPVVQEILSHGGAVHLFPEGEIAHYSRALQPFRTGLFYLAARFQKPLVPVLVLSHPARLLNLRLPMVFSRIDIVVLPLVQPPPWLEDETGLRDSLKLFAAAVQKNIQREMDEAYRNLP